MSRRKTISARLRRQVAERAGHRCSYCRSPEIVGMPMVVDHVIPQSAGGITALENLALACYRCNEFKGARTSALDPQTSEMVPLFNPCVQEWHRHFVWSDDGLRIIGRTAVGRATVEALRLNNEWLVSARRIWIRAGLHPPLE
ncbi:MAG: HNH endonuclease [Anaerolineae bacterium]|nr:HNH endonuclease [Anaerolineae bacterium]